MRRLKGAWHRQHPWPRSRAAPGGAWPRPRGARVAARFVPACRRASATPTLRSRGQAPPQPTRLPGDASWRCQTP